MKRGRKSKPKVLEMRGNQEKLLFWNGLSKMQGDLGRGECKPHSQAKLDEEELVVMTEGSGEDPKFLPPKRTH